MFPANPLRGSAVKKARTRLAGLGIGNTTFVSVDTRTGELDWWYANPSHAFFSSPAIGEILGATSETSSGVFRS